MYTSDQNTEEEKSISMYTTPKNIYSNNDHMSQTTASGANFKLGHTGFQHNFDERPELNVIIDG